MISFSTTGDAECAKVTHANSRNCVQDLFLYVFNDARTRSISIPT